MNKPEPLGRILEKLGERLLIVGREKVPATVYASHLRMLGPRQLTKLATVTSEAIAVNGEKIAYFSDPAPLTPPQLAHLQVLKSENQLRSEFWREHENTVSTLAKERAAEMVLNYFDQIAPGLCQKYEDFFACEDKEPISRDFSPLDIVCEGDSFSLRSTKSNLPRDIVDILSGKGINTAQEWAARSGIMTGTLIEKLIGKSMLSLNDALALVRVLKLEPIDELNCLKRLSQSLRKDEIIKRARKRSKTNDELS